MKIVRKKELTKGSTRGLDIALRIFCEISRPIKTLEKVQIISKDFETFSRNLIGGENLTRGKNFPREISRKLLK